MNKFNAVIFDLDGTLIDSMGIWFDVDREFLTKRGIVPPKNFFDDIKGGNSFVETAQFFKDRFSLDESTDEIMDEWTKMVAHHYKYQVKLKSNATDLLNYLKEKNIKLAVGTSNSLYLTKTVLQANDVLSFFDVIVAGDDDIKGKPFPDIFLKAAELINEQPQNILVVEDTLSGVKAAKNAKIKVCGIYDKHSERNLSEIKKLTDWFVNDFKEMKNLFKRIL